MSDSVITGVVLASGEGVRMRPLSKLRAKGLLPILGIPMVSWGLSRLKIAGLDRAWVNCFGDPSPMRREVERCTETLGMSVSVSVETGITLGTAGALRRFAQDLETTFVTANADSLSDAPLADLIDLHRSAGGIGTLLAVGVEEGGDFIIDQGWVTELVNRKEGHIVGGHTFAGIAVFEPDVLRYIPEGPHGLFETVMTQAMAEDRGLAVMEWDGYFRDVGTPADYLHANLDALGNTFDNQGIPELLRDDPLERSPTTYIGWGSRTGGSDMRHVVIGKRATIAPGSRLDRCVVWDDAEIPKGAYRDSILTGSGEVKIR